MRAISIWSLILLAGLLCAALFPAEAPAAGAAAETYVFHRSWSAAGDQLRFPRGLAVAPNGDLYIANGDLHRIVYVRRGDRTFSVLASFGREPGEFDSPGDIALDTAGNLYITDTGNHRVQVLSATGQFIRQWGGLTNTGEAGKFKYPQGIVVDPAGFVYVVDTYNHRIQKFTLDGQYRSQWGSQGSGAGQFSYPEGLARDAAGNLYVADLGNSRLQKFAADGSYLTKWGNWGSGNGQFKNPWGVAVDADGYVYVADSGNNRMQKFTSSGVYWSQWGSAGPNPGQLNDPGAVDVGYSAQGAAEVYVVDSASYRVQKFSAGGDYLRQWGSATNTDQLWRPRGLALGLTGDVYVADANNSRVQVYSPTGTWLRSWGSFGTGAGQFDAVSDIAIDGAGRVFVGETPRGDAYPPRDDPANHRVQVFTAAGGLLTTFGISGTAPGEFRYPNGLDLDTAGNLYVADTGNNRVQKLHFDAATNTLAFVKAWGAYGTDPSQFYYPSGIAVDAARGVLYVGDTRNHRIQKFTLDGVFVKTWGALGTGAGQFDLTSGVAVDSEGNVYVTDGQNLSRPGTSPLNQRVQKFTSEGVFVTQWGSSGGLAGEFYQPDGIAVDPSGEVYVVDSSNDRVQVFGPAYPALDPVSGLVQNGAFEAGLAGWASGGGLPVSLEAGSGPTGAAVRLGAPVPATAQGESQAWLQQTIYVDPAWSTPRLSVAYRALTNHTTDYSDLLVGVQDAAGLQYLATALRDGCSTIYQPPAATDLGWRTGSLDLSAFKGNSIRLTLYNRNLWPGSKGIWTYIDDVRVVDAGPALPYRFFLPLTIRPGAAPLCP